MIFIRLDLIGSQMILYNRSKYVWKKNVERGQLGITKGDFKSEDTGKFLNLQHKYFKSLSSAKNLNFHFPAYTSKQLIQIFAQDSELEYLC